MKRHIVQIILALAIVVCSGVGLATTVYAASVPEPESEGMEYTQEAEAPNTIILNLGPEWAATEFQVESDSGADPQVIRVSPEGVLTLDLDGGYIYTLSLDPETQPNRGEPMLAAAVAPEDSSVAAEEPGEESGTEVTDEDDGNLFPGVPNLHLFLFAGGLVICIGILVVMAILKRRRMNTSCDDDDYEEE